MTKDEALRLALEALEGVLDDSPKVLDASISGGLYEVVQCRDAITAIKAALEANDEKDGSPCPEFWDWLPKAYRNGDVDDLPKFTKYNMEVAFLAGKQSAVLEAKDEPVGWAEHGVINWLADKQFNHTSFLYATPSQRTWVALTDEEISDCMEMSIQKTCRAIEAKLKEKNCNA